MIRIYSANGFVREFWEKVKEHKTLKSAYESLEREHIEIFGKRKYSDYNSFRVCRDRKVKETMLHKK
tara:strand:- start:646 stop:846 length:201 start_codon:yes stop_codon:yes gene_type:complete